MVSMHMRALLVPKRRGTAVYNPSELGSSHGLEG
jgi:hypothetical protein